MSIACLDVFSKHLFKIMIKQRKDKDVFQSLGATLAPQCGAEASAWVIVVVFRYIHRYTECKII